MIAVWGSGIKTEPNTHKMKCKRRRHDPEFKARVALEALKGIKTIQQIAKEFDIHPVQVSDWKKTMAGTRNPFGKRPHPGSRIHLKIRTDSPNNSRQKNSWQSG